MESIYSKIFVLILIFIGEALAIYAEMVASKNYNLSGEPFLYIFLKMFLLITVAGGFLLLGYMLGFKAFKNIWIVSASSITLILIVEPIMAWSFFNQMPTTGAIIGFALGAIGLFFTIFL